MTATQFYQHVHGQVAEHLSKDAIIRLMESFADHKFDEFKKKKTVFNTEQWIANTEEVRKKFKK
jgi:hypothetical protein